MSSNAGQPATRRGAAWAGSHWLSAWVVVPAIVLIVVGSKLAAIGAASELNVDESQLMAQVMRLRIDPVPWRGMDGTTGGPLNTWALALAHAGGLPLDYRWVHLLAAIVLAATCVLTYATLRVLVDRALAAWGAAAHAVAIALTSAHFYSSELLPALLSSLVLLGAAVHVARPRWRPLAGTLSAVVIGALPWTKLQAVTGSGVLALWFLYHIVGDPEPDSGVARGRRDLVLFACALVAPTVFVLARVVAGGAWADFWDSYVLGNLSYVGRPSPLAFVRRTFILLFAPPNHQVTGTVWLAAAWWSFGRPGWNALSTPLRDFAVGAAVFTAGTTLAVLTPRVSLPHYYLLLVQPLALLAACVLAAGRESGGWGSIALPWLAGLVLAAPLADLPAALAGARATLALGRAADATPEARVARAVRAAAPNATRLAVWGWMPALYVRTGMAPATRHAVCHFVIDPGPARERMRASFLADVRRERPGVIVDAIASGCFRWGWGTAQRLESFPELFAFVRANYDPAPDVSLGGDPSEPVRMYVLRRTEHTLQQ